MSLDAMLSDQLWDAPFYKKLALNDTGKAAGHQGGMVIPKDLRDYFPGLVGSVSAVTPTLDHRIQALLYVDNRFVGSVFTRYQIQTWGGNRSPESRLTDQLGPLRNKASEGDYLIIQRRLGQLDQYRLLLVTSKSSDYSNVRATTVGRKWGVLGTVKPLGNEELIEAEQEEVTTESAPFALVDESARKVETRALKMARSLVFRKTVLRIYGGKCCVCGEGMTTPDGIYEVQAAHIVSRSVKGSDDARNGLSLCARHHWAFDRGLFGIDGGRKVVVSEAVKRIPQNAPMLAFNGKPIVESSDRKLMAASEAFEWHIKNVLLRI